MYCMLICIIYSYIHICPLWGLVHKARHIVRCGGRREFQGPFGWLWLLPCVMTVDSHHTPTSKTRPGTQARHHDAVCMSMYVFIYSSPQGYNVRIHFPYFEVKKHRELTQFVQENGMSAFRPFASYSEVHVLCGSFHTPLPYILSVGQLYFLFKMFESTFLILSLSPPHFPSPTLMSSSGKQHSSWVPRSEPALCGSVCKFESEHHHVPLWVFRATKYLHWQVTVERVSCVRVASA